MTRSLTDAERTRLDRLARKVADTQSKLERMYDVRAQLWDSLISDGVTVTELAVAVGVSRAAITKSIEVWKRGRSHQWSSQ
jgi:plasmid maintenance system antidote protein VapI